jgi:hypothetical protein
MRNPSAAAQKPPIIQRKLFIVSPLWIFALVNEDWMQRVAITFFG